MKIKKIGKARIYHEKNFVHNVQFVNDFGNVIATVTREQAIDGFTWRGIECKSNGTGPSNNKVAYWACQKISAGRVFDIASEFHDVIGAMGDAVTRFKTWNLIWFWINYIECIPKTKWWIRWYYHGCNRAGLTLLNTFGRSSYSGVL